MSNEPLEEPSRRTQPSKCKIKAEWLADLRVSLTLHSRSADKDNAEGLLRTAARTAWTCENAIQFCFLQLQSSSQIESRMNRCLSIR